MRRNFVTTTTPIGASFSSSSNLLPREAGESSPLPNSNSNSTLPSKAIGADAGDVFALPTEIGESVAAIGEAMPIGNAAFDRAVAHGGGHMVTIKPSADTYMPVYYDAHGKSHAGKVHHVKHPHHPHHHK